MSLDVCMYLDLVMDGYGTWLWSRCFELTWDEPLPGNGSWNYGFRSVRDKGSGELWLKEGSLRSPDVRV